MHIPAMRPLLLALPIVAAAATLSARRAPAAVFAVDAVRDDGDAAPGDGRCATVRGDCTLRAALQEANASRGVDTVELPAGTFPLGGSVLAVTESVVLAGEGSPATTIAGPGALRLRATSVVAGLRFDDAATVLDDALPRSAFVGTATPAAATRLAPLAAAAPAPAFPTFTVTSVRDAVDANPGDGVCAAADGTCTLRAAIQESNAGATGTRIVLPAGTYALVLAGANEDAGATGDLDLYTSVEIDGAGADVTVIDGLGLDRIVEVHTAAMVVLSGVTLRHGHATGGGGAIEAFNGPILRDVVLTGNSTDGQGGAVACGFGGLTLMDSVVAGNIALGSGGGIANFNAGAFISRSTVRGNLAGGEGGGIASAIVGSSVMLEDSTVDGNAAGRTGGGIWSGGSKLRVSGSTISRNWAPLGGGFGFEGGSLRIANSTISGNGGGGLAGGVGAVLRNVTVTGNHGGGLVFGLRTGSADVANTIVAGNDPADCDLGPSDASSGYNLLGVGCTLAGDQTGNHGVTTALLGPLADNGGPTRTHALLAGDPAIDGGNPAGCLDPSGQLLTTDQRGAPRPEGAACDAGAFESACGNGVVDPGETCDLGPDDGAPGSCCTASCTLRPAGDPCRAASVCEAEARCDGVAPQCPPGTPAPDTDGDGYCDARERQAGCDPSAGDEIPAPALAFAGVPDEGAANLLLTFAAPSTALVDVAHDPACATAGRCDASGFCAAGRIADPCRADRDCDLAPATCRVVLRPGEIRAHPVLATLASSHGRAGGPILHLPGLAHPGCARKLDVPVDDEPTVLTFRVFGTARGRPVADADTLVFRR